MRKKQDLTPRDRYSSGMLAWTAFAACLATGASLTWLAGSDLRATLPGGLVASALVGWFTYRARTSGLRT